MFSVVVLKRCDGITDDGLAAVAEFAYDGLLVLGKNLGFLRFWVVPALDL